MGALSNSWSMEHGKELKDNLQDPKSLGGEGKSVAPSTRRGAILGDIFMAGKPTLSYADFHHEITRIEDDPVTKPSGMQHSDETGGRAAAKVDEVVKYMSNVPSFLEKGKNFQEKALNFGVLNWGRLEKWQSNNRSMTEKPNVDSPASSSSSFFSTDGSSPHSSIGQCSSPACRTIHHHPTKDSKPCSDKGQVTSPSQRIRGHFPQSHQAKAYPLESNPRNGHTLPRASQKFQKPSASMGSNEKAQQKSPGAKQFPGKVQEKVGLERCQGRPHDLKLSSEMVRPKTGIKLVEPNSEVSGQGCEERPRTVVLLLPRDQVETCSDASRVLNFSKVSGWMPAASQRGSSSETNRREESHGSECFTTSEPYSLSSQDESKESAGRTGACYTDAKGLKVSSQPSQKTYVPAQISNLASGVGASEGKEPIPAMKSRSEVMLSADLCGRTASESLVKSRTPSPIHKFSHGMTRMIKSASSRDNSPQRKSISRDNTSKSWQERAAAAVSSDHSCVDKVHGNNRGRSSPLRRLLDPLLKTKSSQCIHPTEQLKYDSVVTARPCKPQNDQVHLRDSEPTKAVSGLTSSSGSSGSYQNLKHGLPAFQAILRLAVKNGLPLFTFAVDKSGDILVASWKKSSAPGKGPSGGLYTFFTVCEIKRKNGIWPYQAPKKNDHNYISNVVAYMKASDQCSPCVGQKSVVDDDLREFSLFSMDLDQIDEPQTECPTAKELAAIVVRLPKTGNCNPSKACSPEGEDFLHFGSGANSRKDSSFPVIFSTTVILPGGVHSVPSNGAVSTLTQRWRSGGSCDCGGWDLGCQMRIYSDKNELKSNSNSCKTRYASDELELFSEAGLENHESVFSFTSFKDCVYSVKFSSSFSMLQAFAISIAVLECKSPSGFIEPSGVPEEPAPGLAIPELLFQTKASKESHREAPSRYFTYPPNSPVGRV
ncbi:hypothetical protein Droror1_Dr00003251 [Drosera rotundifolia]